MKQPRGDDPLIKNKTKITENHSKKKSRRTKLPFSPSKVSSGEIYKEPLALNQWCHLLLKYFRGVFPTQSNETPSITSVFPKSPSRLGLKEQKRTSILSFVQIHGEPLSPEKNALKKRIEIFKDCLWKIRGERGRTNKTQPSVFRLDARFRDIFGFSN